MERIWKRASWIGTIALGLLLLAALATVAKGGPLDPPAAPCGSGNCTQENLIFQPTNGCTGFPILINDAPGSYKLAQNITMPASCNRNGIHIQGNDVLLDLNGFTVSESGNPNTSLSGIVVETCCQNFANITIKNGNLERWGAYGVDASHTGGAELQDLRSFANGLAGVKLGDNGVAHNITSSLDSTFGITGGIGNVLTDCNVSSTGAAGPDGPGISLGANSKVADCVSIQNQGDGIVVGANSVVRDCVASSNFAGGNGIVAGAGAVITNCSVIGNAARGIKTMGVSGVLVTGCTARGNTDGIAVGSDSFVHHNEASGNTTGSGIYADGDRDRFEDNASNGNNWGFYTAGQKTEVAKNEAANNTTANYTDGSGLNDFGPTGSVSSGTLNAWANISH